MIVQYKEKMSVDNLCRWAEVAKSSLYYQVHPGPRGMKPSTHTIHRRIEAKRPMV
jgi:hypothetical protein